MLDVPLVPSNSGLAQSVHQPAYVRPDATGATHVLTHSAPSLPTNVPGLPTNVSFGVLDVPLVPSSSGLAQSVHQPAYVRPDATGATHVLAHSAPSLPSNVPTEVLDVPLVPSSSGVAQSVHQPAYVRPDATGATHVLTHSAPSLPTNVPSLPTNVSFGVLDVPLVPSSSGLVESVHQPAYFRSDATSDIHLLAPSALK